MTKPTQRTTRARAALRVLAQEIEACTRCPRLVRHREAIARDKRRAYESETYWGRGVPGFGDPDATLLVVGLAPGAHGANRTGRAFTGDSSGDFLFAALHRRGLASQPSSTARRDGLVLRGVFITLPVRCVPPDNAPSSAELSRCRPFFEREIAALSRVRSVLALGAIAWAALLGARAPRFAHGATAALLLPSRLTPTPVFASYHVSRQNTQTGRLTPEMFDEILRAATSPASV